MVVQGDCHGQGNQGSSPNIAGHFQQGILANHACNSNGRGLSRKHIWESIHAPKRLDTD